MSETKPSAPPSPIAPPWPLYTRGLSWRSHKVTLCDSPASGSPLRGSSLRNERAAWRSPPPACCVLRGDPLRSGALRSAALRGDPLHGSALRSGTLCCSALHIDALLGGGLRGDALCIDALRGGALHDGALGHRRATSAAAAATAVQSGCATKARTSQVNMEGEEPRVEAGGFESSAHHGVSVSDQCDSFSATERVRAAREVRRRRTRRSSSHLGPSDAASEQSLMFFLVRRGALGDFCSGSRKRCSC